MPSPFPGMNPYLEASTFWSSVHSRLIVAIADAIAVALRPRYYVEVEKRVYLSVLEDSILVGIPDVSVFSRQPAPQQETENDIFTAAAIRRSGTFGQSKGDPRRSLRSGWL